MKELLTTLSNIIPTLLNKTAVKVESQTDAFTVTAYWVGTVLRIDVKPR